MSVGTTCGVALAYAWLGPPTCRSLPYLLDLVVTSKLGSKQACTMKNPECGPRIDEQKDGVPSTVLTYLGYQEGAVGG